MENTNKITFIKQKKLPIAGLSLVFRVKSIYEKFGTLHDFANLYRVEGITNDELLIIPQQKEKMDDLDFLFDNKLGTRKFKMDKDVTIFFGLRLPELLKRNDSLTNDEIPECKGADWLGSEITDDGYLVWENPSETYGCSVKWGTNAQDDKMMKYFQKKLLRYFTKTDPGKLTLHPKIDELRKGCIWYKMDNHERALSLSAEKLFEIKKGLTIIININNTES